MFSLSWIFLIVYRNPEAQKIYSRHAQLGSGQRLPAARRNRKLKGSKSWICPSLFQPSRGGQCAVLVVLLMSRLTVGTTKMMNVWYAIWKLEILGPGGRCTFPILLCWSTSPPSELSNAGCDPLSSRKSTLPEAVTLKIFGISLSKYGGGWISFVVFFCGSPFRTSGKSMI